MYVLLFTIAIVALVALIEKYAPPTPEPPKRKKPKTRYFDRPDFVPPPWGGKEYWDRRRRK